MTSREIERVKGNHQESKNSSASGKMETETRSLQASVCWQPAAGQPPECGGSRVSGAGSRALLCV